MEFDNMELIKEREINYHLLNISNDPIIITDGIEISFKNISYLELLRNLNLDENIKLEELFSIMESDEVKLNLETLNQLIINNAEICIQKDGVKFCFIVKVQFLEKNNSYIIYLSDITQQVQFEEDKNRLLYSDNLTSLPNRIKLVDDLRFGNIDIQSLCIIDIVGFVEVNDFFGHRVGDEILKRVAHTIKSMISEYSNLDLYKFPADIYCVVNEDDNKEAFEKIIQGIIEYIDEKVYLIDQNEIDVRVVAGVSFSEKNNKLITADLALQAAKKGQEDYIVFYDKLDNINEYQNNIEWTKKIKYALENDKIMVYYQPLINNKTMEVEKYECLVRMIDGKKVVSPFFFLNISKKANQYHKITKVVIEKSCKIFSNIDKEFSVNISYDDIIHDDFLPFLNDIYKKYNIKNKIVFEILEDESVKDYGVLKEFIENVKKLGCKVAIDDFGSGYSNFEHLLKMDIDYLKIDASIIKNVAVDSNSYKITKTLVEFANSLNVKTIAEFVENREIFDIVKDLGSHYSQGYYFSEPLVEPDYKGE